MNQSGIIAPQSSGIVEAPATVEPNVIPSAGNPSIWSSAMQSAASSGSPGPS